MEDLRNDRLPKTYLFLIALFSSFSLSFMLISMQQSFSEKTGSTDISLVNASFVPLSNTDANQIKANVEYTLEKEKMQNQLVNMVMEVYASNGSLIRTTSIGGGFTLQSNGGEHLLRTSINDKTLEDVSIKILLTDLSKKIPLSNTITKHLKLEQP
jgi:hypothetical protein